MNNQKEIYEALLDGETLINVTFNKVHLNEEDFLVSERGEILDIKFINPNLWQIYKEPKWYENIPEGGVLCWVSGNLQIVRAYDKAYEYGFMITEGHCCKNPTPLTKQETQVFMDNAP